MTYSLLPSLFFVPHRCGGCVVGASLLFVVVVGVAFFVVPSATWACSFLVDYCLSVALPLILHGFLLV